MQTIDLAMYLQHLPLVLPVLCMFIGVYVCFECVEMSIVVFE